MMSGPWEQHRSYGAAARRPNFPSRSSSLDPTVPVSSLTKPLPSSPRCHQLVTDRGLASRDLQKGNNNPLSPKIPASRSGLQNGQLASRNGFSQSGTSRSSHAYLAGSRGSRMLGPSPQDSEKLFAAQWSPDYRKPEQRNLAARRNRPKLQLQGSISSQESASSRSLLREVSPLLDNAATFNPTELGTPSSLSSSISLSRYSTDSRNGREATTEPILIKLDLKPVSPLSSGFVNAYQVSTPTTTPKHNLLHEPVCATASESRSACEQASSPRGQVVSSVPSIPIRRGSLLRIPGVATRPAPTDNPTGFPGCSTATASIASVLASVSSTDVDAAHVIDEKPKVSDNLSVPGMPNTIEQARSVTPSADMYQQLGGIKLGTLRITNASPTPSSVPDSGKVLPTEPREPDPMIEQHTKVDCWQSSSVKCARHLSHTPASNPPALSTTDTTQNVTTDTLNRPLSGPGTLKQDQCWFLGDTLGSESVNKRLSNLMELIEDPFDDSFRIPRTVYAGPSQEPPSQVQSEEVFTKDAPSPEYSTNETLDVRFDSSAKSIRNEWDEKLANRPLQRVLSNPDSGFISATSSLSSRGTPSNSDSAYSSNGSIQLKHADMTSGIADKATSAGVPKPEAGHAGRGANDPAMEDRLKDQSRTSFMSMSKSSIRRFSSRIRPRHSFSYPGATVSRDDVNSNASHDKTETLQSEWSFPRHSHGSKPSLNRADCNGQAIGKVQKIATGFSLHDVQTVPTVPPAMEERLREHNELFPTASMRLTKKSNLSEESLETIVSVNSNNECEVEYSESNYSRDSMDHENTCNADDVNTNRTHRRSQSSIESVRTVMSSASTRTVKSIASSKSATGDSTLQWTNDAKISQIELSELIVRPAHEVNEDKPHSQEEVFSAAFTAFISKQIVVQEPAVAPKPVPPPRNPARHQSHANASKALNGPDKTEAFDIIDAEPACRARTTDDVPERRRASTVKMGQDQVQTWLNTYKLRASASEPKLVSLFTSKEGVVGKRGTNSTVVDLFKELPPEPPRQLLLRSSFSRRSLKQNQRNKDDCPWPQKTHLEIIRGHQVHQGHHHPARGRSGRRTTILAPGQTPVVRDDLSAPVPKRRHSTLIHRPAFSTSLAISSLQPSATRPKPPYRVLHSYNSPAYKHIPIWG